MNKPKKIIFAVLGIAASVGLGSLIAAWPWAVTTGRCWERATSSIPVCPTPAPKKPKTITLTFSSGPHPLPITLEEPYAHGRKTPLSFHEAVDNYYWTGAIASLHRCSPGPDANEVNTYIKKKHPDFYDEVIAEVARREAKATDDCENTERQGHELDH